MQRSWLATTQVLFALVIIGGCNKSEESQTEQAREQAVEELNNAIPGLGDRVNTIAKQSKWIESNGIDTAEYQQIQEQWVTRTNFVGTDPAAAFWDIAKDSTPAQLNKDFPPLTDQEWFSASIHLDGIGSSFTRDFSNKNRYGGEPEYHLRIQVRIRTIPDKPIKSFTGDLTVRDQESNTLHQEPVEYKPDVSFVDMAFVYIRIDYDDTNPLHRSLRFDKTLEALFVLSTVTFADGSIQEY